MGRSHHNLVNKMHLKASVTCKGTEGRDGDSPGERRATPHGELGQGVRTCTPVRGVV